MRLGGEGAEQRLVPAELDGRSLTRRPGEEVELGAVEIDRVHAGERRRELLGKRRPRGRVFGVAQETAGERLALHVVHDEERRAQHRCVFLAPAHARHRDARRRGGAQQEEFVAAARLDHVPRRVAAEDQPFRRPVGRRHREQPGLARRAARQPAQLRDARVGTELGAEVGREPGREISQGDASGRRRRAARAPHS